MKMLVTSCAPRKGLGNLQKSTNIFILIDINSGIVRKEETRTQVVKKASYKN